MGSDDTLLCLPGQRLSILDQKHISGSGTYARQGYIYSMLAGVVSIVEKNEVKYSPTKQFSVKNLKTAGIGIPRNISFTPYQIIRFDNPAKEFASGPSVNELRIMPDCGMLCLISTHLEFSLSFDTPFRKLPVK